MTQGWFYKLIRNGASSHKQPVQLPMKGRESTQENESPLRSPERTGRKTEQRQHLSFLGVSFYSLALSRAHRSHHKSVNVLCEPWSESEVTMRPPPWSSRRAQKVAQTAHQGEVMVGVSADAGPRPQGRSVCSSGSGQDHRIWTDRQTHTWQRRSWNTWSRATDPRPWVQERDSNWLCKAEEASDLPGSWSPQVLRDGQRCGTLENRR